MSYDMATAEDGMARELRRLQDEVADLGDKAAAGTRLAAHLYAVIDDRDAALRQVRAEVARLQTENQRLRDAFAGAVGYEWDEL